MLPCMEIRYFDFQALSRAHKAKVWLSIALFFAKDTFTTATVRVWKFLKKEFTGQDISKSPLVVIRKGCIAPTLQKQCDLAECIWLQQIWIAAQREISPRNRTSHVLWIDFYIELGAKWHSGAHVPCKPWGRTCFRASLANNSMLLASRITQWPVCSFASYVIESIQPSSSCSPASMQIKCLLDLTRVMSLKCRLPQDCCTYNAIDQAEWNKLSSCPETPLFSSFKGDRQTSQSAD